MPAIPQFFPGLPDYPAIAALREKRQWVAWRYEDRNGKLTKPPIAPASGRGASHSNPVTWGSYDEALARAQKDHLPGIGFVLDDRDGLTGADLDKCRDASTGKLDAWAADIVALKETYTEVSPSGTGLRLIWRGKVADPLKCDPAHVEVYRSLRYLTITGQHVPGTPLELCVAPLTAAALQKRVAAFRAPEETPKLNGSAPLTDFRLINDKALADLGAWVPHIFPRAKFQPATRAYRVSSRDLGRSLEEDLSLSPSGIVDFGIADLGDGRQGKRSPIDIVIEHGGSRDLRDAASWLAGRLGMPDPFALDPVAATSQRALAARVQQEPEPIEQETHQDIEARLRLTDLVSLLLPSDPLTPAALGGTLQWVAEECLEMARRPVPAYSTLAAIMVGTTIFGRAWRGFTNTSLNLFTIITGRSGQGKSWPPNAVRLLLNECGIGDRIGGRQPSSDSAIEKRLKSSPVLIYCLDEIGKMFERLGASRAGNHERKVMDILLELWGQGTMPWAGKDAATPDSHRGEDIIWYPTLSLIGATTIEPLFKSMNETNVKDGMFARLLVVSVDDRPEENEDARDGFSSDLIEAVRDMWAASLEKHQAIGNMAAAALRGSTTRPPTEKVEAAQDAKRLVREIERWSNVVSEDDDAVNGIVNRAAESVVRLASIRALSRNPKDPVAGIEDVQWGWTIVARSLSFVSGGIERHMAGSEFEAIKKAMLRAMEKVGEDGIQRWKLFRASGVKQAEPRHQESALNGLLETREIELLKAGASSPSGGRPAERFRLKK